MEVFGEIEQKIDDALAGKGDSREFYREIAAKMVHLTPPQRQELIGKAERLDEQDPAGRASLLLIKGMRCIFEADFPSATGHLSTATEIFSIAKFYSGRMSAENLLSVCYRSIGQLEKAQVHMQNALKALEKVQKGDMFWYFQPVTFYQAGELCLHTGNYDGAREYYQRGMEFADNPELVGRLLSGMGNLLMVTKDWEKAIDYFMQALGITKESENYLLESKLYADVGNYYLKKGDHNKALENQNISLNIRLEKKLANPAITNYIQLAEIYLMLGDLEEAVRFGNLAVENAAKLNVVIKLYEAHHILSRIYEKSEQPQKAYGHFKQFHKYKEEVHNQETIKKIEQLQSSHKIELMQNEKEIFRLRNVELKQALEEIQDSFRYASRIQNSLLPSEKYIERAMERLKGHVRP